MSPTVPGLPGLEVPDLSEGSAYKPGGKASFVTDDDSTQSLDEMPSTSGHRKTKSKDVKYIVRDGNRTISSWENPSVEEPVQSNVRGKGTIFDIYFASKRSGSRNRLDHDMSMPTDIKVVTNSESESKSESEVENEVVSRENNTDRFNDTASDIDDQRRERKATSPKTDQERSSFNARKKRRRPHFVRLSAAVVGMTIHSPHLKRAIRSLITYYPAQILTGNFIAIDAPFQIIWHCYHDLYKLVDRSPTGDNPSHALMNPDSEANDIATRNHHLTVLLDYLNPQYIKAIKPAEDRHREGLTSYEMLWLLFKPGCDVYARVGGDLAGFILSSAVKDSTLLKDETTGNKRLEHFWTIRAWNLDYNSGKFVRTTRSFTIKKFDGEKEISSLPIFPSQYLDSFDHHQTREKLERRGKTYLEYICNVPVHLGYQGMSWDHRLHRSAWRKKAKLQYDGEIIIDPAAFQTYTSESPATASGSNKFAPVRVYNSSSLSSSEDGEPNRFEEESRWLDYENIDPKSPTTLKEHYYFLIPRRVNGFALKQKRWMGFDIEGIKPLEWSPTETSAMTQLIIPPRDIEIIKALSGKHAIGNNIKWGADFIPGKGEGQVFLLHGPPGTGKTYTVECVADYTRRPLICLTVADIGTDEVRMEANLSRWFTVAASWQAIILIDEADVFLERRQGANLQRSSLVSVFLRCMEYYPGMLFLTTNRIGQIDDAFLSRTSVALTYEPLSASVQLRIWFGFISKLERERNDVIVTDRARTFLEEDEDMKSVSWNGREIRNALQTAFALAMYDAEQDFKRTGQKAAKVEVDKEHFSKVVLRRKTFVKYRDDIRRQNEDQRALGEGSRALPKRS